MQDEDETLKQPCHFCGETLSEYGDICKHVICARGSLNPFICINPVLTNYIKVKLTNFKDNQNEYEQAMEYEDDAYEYCEEFLHTNENLFSSLTKLEMCFLANKDNMKEFEDSWIGESVEGPQDPCVFYLINDEDLKKFKC